eukprot:scaffold73342_cov33-Tisochrysis_lutea.AAC.2
MLVAIDERRCSPERAAAGALSPSSGVALDDALSPFGTEVFDVSCSKAGDELELTSGFHGRSVVAAGESCPS